MKKLALLTTLCALSVVTHSADWTPVFKHWEQNSSSNSKAANVLGKIWSATINNSSASTKSKILKPKAAKGQYPSVPAPYRADMLAAKVTIEDDGMKYVTIPLKNATLYGLPISSITEYFNGYDSSGTYITFKPMTDAQYKRLTQKKFKVFRPNEDVCGNHKAMFEKVNGKVLLSLYEGC